MLTLYKDIRKADITCIAGGLSQMQECMLYNS